MNDDIKKQLTHEMVNLTNVFKRRGFQHHQSHQNSMRPSEMMFLSQLSILAVNSEKGIKVSDLSNHMQITPAAATHIIDILVEKGFVERKSDLNDRRIVLISLTDSGQETLKNMDNKIMKKFGGLVEYLGENDSRELIRLLSSTFDYLKLNENDN